MFWKLMIPVTLFLFFSTTREGIRKNLFGKTNYTRDSIGFTFLQDTMLSIYLTFDDGPEEPSTYIDSLVRVDSVPLEVFLIGKRVGGSPVLKDIFNDYRANPLIEIANHSFTHANGHYRLYYADPGKVVNDILKNEDSLRLSLRFARLPGRNTWRIAGTARTDLADANPAADSLVTHGFQLFGWDMEWLYDSCRQRYYSAEQMISLMRYVAASGLAFRSGHIVLLCHDWMLPDPYFREQLPLFIKAVRKNKLARFSQLSAYPGVIGLDKTLIRKPF